MDICISLFDLKAFNDLLYHFVLVSISHLDATSCQTLSICQGKHLLPPILLAIGKSWLMQESAGLSADWFWDIKSFSMKKMKTRQKFSLILEEDKLVYGSLLIVLHFVVNKNNVGFFLILRKKTHALSPEDKFQGFVNKPSTNL